LWLEGGADNHEDSMDHASHDNHAGHSVAMFREKFWISLLLTTPAIVWGEMNPGGRATRLASFFTASRASI
jgi:hypothetical protein